MRKHFQSHIVIIGSGASGLAAALHLANTYTVTLLSKTTLASGATSYAQGGIAAVLAPEDSIQSHLEDTLQAGAGLSCANTAQAMLTSAPNAIAWLQTLGLPFTETKEGLHLNQEGGHRTRRIAHTKDKTGAALSQTLLKHVKEHPKIICFEQVFATDLILHEGVLQGIEAFDVNTQEPLRFGAPCVLFATGGASKAYLYTTQPEVASGDGMAMAYRAGLPLADLEFNQFHPTCLYNERMPNFLLTEALRGEGATLHLPGSQTRFMPSFDARAELACRDVVARAIDHEMKRLGLPFVHLSLQNVLHAREHFPNIAAHCERLGLCIETDPLPVVPAAHYTCGGIVANAAGETALPGLYAIGETACTGLHGANRLASNSLLECLVMAHKAAKHIEAQTHLFKTLPTLKPPPPMKHRSDEAITIRHNWQELRQCMWDYVGIVRSNARLQKALTRIEWLQKEVDQYYQAYAPTRDLLELRNLTLLAKLMTRAALARKESRGLHFNTDFPDTKLHAQHSWVQKEAPVRFVSHLHAPS